MNDGNIRIGIKITDIDAKMKKLDNQISKFQGRLKNLGREKIPMQSRLQEIDEQMLENERRFKELQTMLSDNKLSASEFKNLGGLEGINKTMNDLSNANDKLAKEASRLDTRLNKIKTSEQEIKDKIDEQISAKEILNQKQQQLQLEQAKQSLGLKDISNEIPKITKKVVKWGLAVFSIRSAYSFLRSSMSTLSQYNEKMSTDIEYIRYALANSLKPIIEWIIKSVYTILTYINYIANAWFGVNLFKNAGAKQFAKDMDSANKSAKEMKKELAGFDVANVMSDTSSSNGKSGAGVPSLDLSKMEQIAIPDWVKWIAEHKDLVIGLASIVGIAFGAAKTTEILTNIGKIFGVAGGKGLIGLATSLANIAATAAGIAIIAYVAYSTWQEIDKLKTEMQNIRHETDEMNKNWQKQLDPVKDLKKETDTIQNNIQSGRENLKKANEIWHKENTKLGTIQHTWAGILGANREYYENAKAIAYRTDVTMETLDKMYKAEGRTKQEKKEIVKTLEEQRTLNYDVIAQMNQEGEDTSYLKWVTQQLTDKIGEYNRELSTTNTKSSLLKDIWDKANTKMEETNRTLNNINNKQIKDKEFNINGKVNYSSGAFSEDLKNKVAAILTSLSGKSDWLSSTMYKSFTRIKQQIGLDGGGIVLPQPGHGVQIGGARMSERRAEAVIPFENPEAMRKIGKAIGEWVNIAIQNNMVVDGRVLAAATNDAVEKENFLMNK